MARGLVVQPPSTDFRYCIMHGREVLIEETESGELFHLLTYNHDRHEVSPLASLDRMMCYGQFTFSPPPPALEEWEWELIFELEGEVYGTESIF